MKPTSHPATVPIDTAAWQDRSTWLRTILTLGRSGGWAALLWVLSFSGFSAEIVVAPGGSDAAPGTAARPLATLEQAVRATRQLPAHPSKRILVRGGHYYNVALSLGPEDSNLTIEAAAGEKPVLYGGQPITGWEKDGDRFFAAQLPAFPEGLRSSEGKWTIRMLEVNGRMAPRARYPAEGSLTHETSFPVPWMSTTGGGWQRKPTQEELTTLQYGAGDLGPWLEPANAEITVYHMWDESCVGIAAHEPDKRLLTLSPPTGHPPGAFGVKKFVLWNIREGLTAPGQWYHDRVRGRLVYWPLPGEDMSQARVIAPATATILRLKGAPGNRITNVTVRGLGFSVTTVPLIAAGFAAGQFDGAISVEEAEDCRFLNLTIARVAGHGLNAKGTIARTRIEASEVASCGAGGIYVGGTRTIIRNNHVHGIGLAYPSAIGIYRGGTSNLVSHNEVHDCSYSAINYGGRSNVIEDNLLYDCMRVLHDGAAIYMFAAQDCILRRNIARDIVDGGGYGASAYYLDERSTRCVVENNLSLRVAWPSHNHMATNNVIRNNVFLVEGDAKLTFPRSTEFTFEKNILAASGKIRIENPGAVQVWSNNLFHAGSGKIERVPLRQYSSAGVAEGPPGDTVMADPLFQDVAKGDYSFRDDSPARKLGIEPIDVSRAGRLSPGNSGEAAVPSAAAGGAWWMAEPIRLIQTNLRETDSTLDPKRLVNQIADFPANALLFNMGGIVAQYPTEVEFHYASPHLPPGRDLFGDVLKEAHARGIRVIGRFDLSKTQPPVFEARPEWFFKRTDGTPAIYNGLYSACINGGYYREHAVTILTEALERYEVDGLFFNMFGNPGADYSGVPMGPCQCDSCKARFQARYGAPLPSAPDARYRQFMTDSAHEVAALLADLIHRKRPQAAFATYVQAHTDIIMSESNTGIDRALPLWPYSASDHVNRARSSEPGKMALNLCMSFVDYPWRFVTVPQSEIQLRLYQAMSHGGPVALNMHGPMDQEDRQALLSARPLFQWHARHAEYYTAQENAARVLLLTGNQNSYRGFFRLLAEQHIPFAVSDNLKWMADPARTFDLVISPSGASPELEEYVRRGGRLLAAGTRPPPFGIGGVIGLQPHTRGSWRIHDHQLFPALRDTRLLFLDGPYLRLEPLPKPLLTLIPPAMFGPPEKVWVDKVESDQPGLVLADHGEGKLAYIPWDVGALYYRHSSQGHAGLLSGLIDHLLPDGRQLTTTAHPLVEVTLMKQPARHRALVHLVNGSGHSGTAYFPPLEMRNIEIQVRQTVKSARALSLGKDLPVENRDGRARLTLPMLGSYELIVLE